MKNILLVYFLLISINTLKAQDKISFKLINFDQIESNKFEKEKIDLLHQFHFDYQFNIYTDYATIVAKPTYNTISTDNSKESTNDRIKNNSLFIATIPKINNAKLDKTS